ncbi:hypothetical protein [Maridesulfovibrio sp.]|jgi:hypothetical protein|uniref:hypothetical protein n=1 Tax=Maridesulfovibrio sp. TaxID=2795000 RepID=UPI0029C9D4EC|nr:hypothetical protein [Maridesulfovibrio sp.]
MKNTNIPDRNNLSTIRGTVLPAQWNARFEITGILIACRDEREVRVGNFECFPTLRNFSQQEAIFTGFIENKDGVESILLESFKPI